MRIEIRLCWHADVDDFDLGIGFVDALPPLGALIVMPTPLGTVWRVVTVYINPAMPGSMMARSTGPVGIYTLFVEPAEGPYHAGEERVDA